MYYLGGSLLQLNGSDIECVLIGEFKILDNFRYSFLWCPSWKIISNPFTFEWGALNRP